MLNGREGPAMLKGAGRKKSKVIHHRIFDQVHIAIAHNDDLQKLSGLRPEFSYFSIEGAICYVGFADDFGPMNLGSISQFCTLLDEEKQRACQRPIALLVPPSRRSLTNAVLLMGAYMILKMDFDDAAAIMDKFADLQEWVVPYKDVTPGPQNFSPASGTSI